MRTPQSHTARESLPSRSALDDLRIPVQAKIAAAWTSFMFLIIYVDYFHLYKPGSIDDILAGVVFEFDISPTLLTIMLASVAIPALMVMLSMTLPARVNRATNLVVATLHIPYVMFNAVGESWDWAFFYGLSIGLELLLLAFILRSAWTWPRRTASPATLTASLDSEPLCTPQQA
jgi:peptidoglycan/LPS O-acetylase OafA/YrhL